MRRKELAARERKEQNKNLFFAKLNNCPTSPRKMRLVADIIRGKNVYDALNILKFSSKEASGRLEKLLLSAISNWEQKTGKKASEKEELFVREVFVDSGRMTKRLRTAPQGRGYRVRKRSNHVTMILDNYVTAPAEEAQAETQPVEATT